MRKSTALVALIFLWSVGASGQTGEGTLDLTCDPAQLTTRRDVEIVADLSSYRGAPITTCQFWVISTGPGRLAGVSRGSSVPEGSGWNFRYSIRPARQAKDGVYLDTAVVVIWGAVGLQVNGPARLASVKVDLPQRTSARVRLNNVMAAVATGDDAGIRAGRELLLARSTK